MRPKYLSVSQVKTYSECGYRYRLERLERKWQRPAAWLPQGTAVHSAAEALERSGRAMTLDETLQAFSEAYDAEIDRYAETTPNMEYWFPSGPYAGPADVERRYGKGREQTTAYHRSVTAEGAPKVWTTPDDTPAIELPFEIDLDGIAVRGVIDQVTVERDNTLAAVDIKTGKRPGDPFQLQTYAVALEQTYNAPVSTGYFWKGTTGKRSRKVDTRNSREAVTEAFRRANDGIEAERFEPNPSKDTCLFCPVATSCPFAAFS